MRSSVFVTVCACALAASAAEMSVRFDASNALMSIRVGAAEFATGGGDLWTAEFACDGAFTNRVKVASGDAASFAKETSGDVDTLRWSDIPLGGERGVLDAQVRIERRPDGAQAWRLEFDNRSTKWVLFATDFPRLNRVVGKGEADAMVIADLHNSDGAPKDGLTSMRFIQNFRKSSVIASEGTLLYVSGLDADFAKKVIDDFERGIRRIDASGELRRICEYYGTPYAPPPNP